MFNLDFVFGMLCGILVLTVLMWFWDDGDKHNNHRRGAQHNRIKVSKAKLIQSMCIPHNFDCGCANAHESVNANTNVNER